MAEKIPKFRKNSTEEDDDSSVVTRGGKQSSARGQRVAEVEMKRLMGGAPEVVSTIHSNPNTDLETQEGVVKDEPWLRPGVIESALMPRIVPPAEKLKADAVSAEAIESPKLSPEEAKKREEKVLGEALGNDIWEELQKLEERKKGGDIEEGHIPEEISQIYGDQIPPLGVLELYKRLNTEKRAEYITDLRIFEEKNKQQETSEIAPVAAVLEAEEQNLIDQNIEANRAAAAPEIQTLTEEVTVPTLTGVVSEEEFKNVGKETEASSLEDFGSIVANPEDAIDQEHMREIFNTEGTPLEWRNKLRGLIEGAKEKVSWYKSSEEKLIRRNAELDADLDKIGGTEKYFRGLGEWYNKRNWKTKLAVGASLGLGAAFSAGVSVPIALACLSGIAAQRIAGLSTMYLKFEKKSHEEAWGKEKAFLKAAVYTAVMGLAIKEGIEYVSETESAHVVQRWLGEKLGHLSLFGATHAPVEQPAAAAATGGEVAATAVAPEIPGIEVKATPGHGYEYMLKRLLVQLQKNHIQLPANANPDSDLAQLLRADEKTIDGVVHKLAQDNQFFKGDGTSAHINLDSKLTIDTNGQIWLDHENIIAPEESVTPTPHTEVPNTPSTLGDNTVLPEVREMTPETNLQPFPESVSEQTVPTAGGQESQVPATSQETSVQTPATVENLIVNKFGLSIPTAETHIYANEAKSLFVYGGTAEQKMKLITEYLTKERDAVLYAENAKGERVPWLHGARGEIIQGEAVREKGLFGGLFNMKAPSPDDLKTPIK